MLDLLAQSPVAFIAAAAAVGLVVGSFLNVVIYRLPLMLERQWQAQCATPSDTTGSNTVRSQGPRWRISASEGEFFTEWVFSL